MVFAIILATIVYVVGKPATPAEMSATVGFVDTNSPAYAQGLRLGDEIMSVNGESVASWYDFLTVCSRFKEVTLVARRGTDRITLSVPTGKGVFGLPMVEGVDGRSLCMVLATAPGMSADRAGLKRGDIIVEFDGIGIFSRAQLISLVGERRGKTAPIKVKRNGDIVTAMVTPDYDPEAKQVRIGIQFNVTDVEFDEIVHPGVWQQIKSHSTAIVRTLTALATPSQAKATSQGIGGPVAILVNYWYIVKISFMVAVFFTGFLNVNLAILNLVPIPVLDGGHIMFSLWEAITRRKPNARVVNITTNVFAALLIAVFVLLTGRDLKRFTPVGRVVERWTGNGSSQPTNSPPPPAPEPSHGTNR
jgi:regulator of sigma E protease